MEDYEWSGFPKKSTSNKYVKLVHNTDENVQLV